MSFIKSKFDQAYLRQLSLIKEDEDVQDTANIITGGDDVKEVENKLQKVIFFTSDEAVINAFKNGFEEAVFFVKSVNDDGEETVEEVKFGPEVFEEITVEDAPVDAEEDAEEEPADETVDEDVEEDDEEDYEEVEECNKQINESYESRKSAYDKYDEYVDTVNEPVKIFNIEYSPSQVLKCVDEPAYRSYANDFFSQEGITDDQLYECNEQDPVNECNDNKITEEDETDIDEEELVSECDKFYCDAYKKSFKY